MKMRMIPCLTSRNSQKNDINKGGAILPFVVHTFPPMAFTGTPYLVTFYKTGQDSSNTQTIEVVAESESMATTRVNHLFPGSTVTATTAIS